MTPVRKTNERLRLIRETEQSLTKSDRDRHILLAMQNEQRRMYLFDISVGVKLIAHQEINGRKRHYGSGDIYGRAIRRLKNEPAHAVAGGEPDGNARTK